MIYTPMTKKAMRIMFAAHRDQTDKDIERLEQYATAREILLEAR